MDSSPQPIAPEATPEPLLLGRYRVMEQRATGGFGSVLVCWDARLQRRVAIKCMPLQPTQGVSVTSTVGEALAEARTSCLLNHPNIVTVFDFEATGDTAFLVMEYVDGITLSELLARVEDGVLTYDECAHLLRSLGDALQFAHDNGVLHLDIKPSNVFIDRSGMIKVGDFGMATLASAAGYGGARGGTVGYMSPEQLDGSLVDERSDTFSLAVVCYQALTGVSPFAAATADESLELISHGAKPLDMREPELEGPVSDAIAAAMDAMPTMRMPTVAELEADVLPYLGNDTEGRASIVELLSQLDGDEDLDERFRPYEHAPLLQRVTWLQPALVRVLSAATCGWIAWMAAGPFLLPLTVSIGLAVAVAGAAALLPQLGSGLALAAIVAALFAGGASSPAVVAAMAVALICGAWWVRVGHAGSLSGPSLLAPACLGFTPLGAPLCAWALTPLAALQTALVGYLLCRLVMAVASQGFSAEATLAWCSVELATPGLWIRAGGTAVAACAASAVYGRASTARGVIGQILCCVLLLGAATLAQGVENGGIWLPPSEIDIGIALLFCVLMIVVQVVLGPPQFYQEGD